MPGKAFYDARKTKIDELKRNADTHPYPHNFPISITLSNYCQKYDHLKSGERIEDKDEQIAGRILSVRRASSKLYFFDVQGDGTKIQMKGNLATYENKDHFTDDMGKIHRGDIVGIHGSPCRTKSGELSIDAKTVTNTLLNKNPQFISYSLHLWHFRFSDHIIGTLFAYATDTTFWYQRSRSTISPAIFGFDFK